MSVFLRTLFLSVWLLQKRKCCSIVTVFQVKREYDGASDDLVTSTETNVRKISDSTDSAALGCEKAFGGRSDGGTINVQGVYRPVYGCPEWTDTKISKEQKNSLVIVTKRFLKDKNEAALAAACGKVAIGEFFQGLCPGCRQYCLEGMVHTTS